MKHPPRGGKADRDGQEAAHIIRGDDCQEGRRDKGTVQGKGEEGYMDWGGGLLRPGNGKVNRRGRSINRTAVGGGGGGGGTPLLNIRKVRVLSASGPMQTKKSVP